MKKYRVNVKRKDGKEYALTYTSRRKAEDCAYYLKEGCKKTVESATIEELED